MRQQKYSKEQLSIQLAVRDIGLIKESVNKIEGRLENKYVTQDQFEPVKKLVYGMVGLILIGVVGSLLALILK